MLCQSAQASLNAVIYGKCLLFLRKGILGYGELRLVTQMLPDCVTDTQENPLTPRLFAKDVNFPHATPHGERTSGVLCSALSDFVPHLCSSTDLDL